MTRLFLCGLLLLTACQKKDPEGTIAPDGDGNVHLAVVKQGDSAPFRLPSGDLEVTLMRADEAPEIEVMNSCEPNLQLVKYEGGSERSVPITGTAFSVARMNAVQPDVYFLRLQAKHNFCEFRVNIRPIKK